MVSAGNAGIVVNKSAGRCTVSVAGYLTAFIRLMTLARAAEFAPTPRLFSRQLSHDKGVASRLDVSGVVGAVLKRVAARDAHSRAVFSEPGVLAALLQPIVDEGSHGEDATPGQETTRSVSVQAMVDVADVLAWFAGTATGRSRVS